jgi:hypothetical protein
MSYFDGTRTNEAGSAYIALDLPAKSIYIRKNGVCTVYDYSSGINLKNFDTSDKNHTTLCKWIYCDLYNALNNSKDDNVSEALKHLVELFDF